MIRKQDSLDYHSQGRPGKIAVHPTKSCLTPRDFRMAYLPGATFPAAAIAANPQEAFRYTARGNLVGLFTDGSAVPGLGNVGPLAAKPMQEGMAILFKRLADIDVFDLELNPGDVEGFVATVKQLEPTFGAVNLKDIQAPHGLEIYDALRASLTLPVFHENRYSTAGVMSAALINALELVDKRIEDLKVVICGAGTVGIGCARLLRRLGVRPDSCLMYNVDGLVHPDQDDLHPYVREFAVRSGERSLAEGLRDADVFLGASAGGVLGPEGVRSMNRYPIVFAMATPEPEIAYETARASRQDALVATGLGQHPNAILDVLRCPYIFRGALDVQATSISEGMLLAAARALAELAREEVPEEVERAYGGHRFSFGAEYLLPKPLDPRILLRESAAVARAAIEEGFAAPDTDLDDYEGRLSIRLGTGRATMRELTMRAHRQDKRVVFSEGTNETVLRACSHLVDEGVAQPILLGSEEVIRAKLSELGLDHGGITIVDPLRSPRFDQYCEEYFLLRQRHGVIRARAAERLRQPDVFGAMMLHCGATDMMIAGATTHFRESLLTLLEIIGPAAGVERVSSHHLVLLPNEVVVLGDCAVNISPTAEQLAETALLAATTSRSLGIEPRVAMLSFSNFGSVHHPNVRRVRQAVEIARARAPGLEIEGEMQLSAARNEQLRGDVFPFARLTGDANVLIFPDLQSGHLAMQALSHMTEAIPIGPLLMGTRLPAHVLQHGTSVEDVVNLVTVGVVEGLLGD